MAAIVSGALGSPTLMKYSQVCLRLKTDSAQLFSSGIYLLDGSTELIVSLCPHFSTALGQHHDLEAALRSGHTPTAVIWDVIELLGIAPLNTTATFKSKFHDFNAKPSERPSVSVFRFKAFSAQRLDQQQSTATLSIAKPCKSAVRIHSSPFGGHLFMGFETAADVAYLGNNHMLLDTRFMEDMMGGVVVAPQGCIGLVQGELAKVGGEGKLVLAVGWGPILNALKAAKLGGSIVDQLANMQKACEAISNSATPSPAPSHSLAVQVKLRGNRRAWGSGVLVRPDIVATNKHVVGDYLSIAVQNSAGTTQVSAVSVPINGVDLAFLKLSSPLKGACMLGAVPAVGSELVSYGYGLIFPGRLGKVQPLQSTGIVAAHHEQKFYENQTKAELALFVSSASCWNGSSGGAVCHKGEVVGIMASNARDETTGEIMPDMAFVIPSNVVKLGLECIDAGRKLNATSSMTRLWELKPVLVDSRRPKL